MEVTVVVVAAAAVTVVMLIIVAVAVSFHHVENEIAEYALLQRPLPHLQEGTKSK